MRGMFALVHPGQVMPEPLVTLALKQFPDLFGTAMLFAEPDSAPEIAINHYDKDIPDVAGFMAAQEANKDVLKLFYFGKDKFTDESLQPFELLEDEHGAVLACSVVITDIDYRKKSEHSDEYHLVNNILRPKLTKTLVKLCDGDLDKLYDEMIEDATKAEMELLHATRGIVLVLLVNGKYVIYEKNNEMGIPDATWGYTTDRLGWDPAAKPKRSFVDSATRTVKAIADVVSLNHKKNTIEGANKVGDTSAEAIAAAMPKEEGEIDLPADAPPSYHALKEEGGKTFIQCPKDLTTKETRRPWFRAWTKQVDVKGEMQIPPGYKNVNNPIWAEANDRFMAAKYGNAKDFKDMKQAAKAKARSIPIIEAAKRKTLTAYIASNEAKAKLESGQVLDAEVLRDPKKSTLFIQQLAETGLTIDDTLRMDHEYLAKLQSLDPVALILLSMEWRDEVLRSRLELDAATAPKGSNKPEKPGPKAPAVAPEAPTEEEVVEEQPVTVASAPRRRSFAR